MILSNEAEAKGQREKQPHQKRPNAPTEHLQQNALSGVRSHGEVSNSSEHSADNEPQHVVHTITSLFVERKVRAGGDHKRNETSPKGARLTDREKEPKGVRRVALLHDRYSLMNAGAMDLKVRPPHTTIATPSCVQRSLGRQLSWQLGKLRSHTAR